MKSAEAIIKQCVKKYGLICGINNTIEVTITKGRDINAVATIQITKSIKPIKQLVIKPTRLVEDFITELYKNPSGSAKKFVEPYAQYLGKNIDYISLNNLNNCIQRLLAHEVAHLYNKDYVLEGVRGRDSFKRVFCFNEISRYMCVLNVLTEIRADIIGTQMVVKSGFASIKSVNDICLAFIDCETDDITAYKSGYPTTKDRKYFAYTYGVVRNNAVEPVLFNSDMAVIIAKRYCTIYGVKPENFLLFLEKKQKNAKKEVTKAWYKVWIDLLKNPAPKIK